MADRTADLQRLVDARERWLAEATERLRADERVRAAWVSGSVGRGEADAWADIDLHLVSPDDAAAGDLSDAKACDAFGELVAWADCRHNAPLGGAMCFARYVLDGELVLVDWHVWPESWARRTPRTHHLFEREGVDLPPTDLDGPELVVRSERNPPPRWSGEEYAVWQVCMVHIASAFPARGHDASRMIELAGGSAHDATPKGRAGRFARSSISGNVSSRPGSTRRRYGDWSWRRRSLRSGSSDLLRHVVQEVANPGGGLGGTLLVRCRQHLQHEATQIGVGLCCLVD